MIEIVFHGRGGQGSVIASEILSRAFFYEGKHVQSFPSFGVERRGAPVMAFLRCDDHPIIIRSQIYKPDHILVLDRNLLELPHVHSSLKTGGWMVVNAFDNQELERFCPDYRVALLDADSIALSYQLGTDTYPIINTTMLGAFAGATDLVSIESVIKAINEVVPIKTEQNVKAAIDANDLVKVMST